MPRDEDQPLTTHPKKSFFSHVGYSAMTTFILHPVRVCMNRAAYPENSNPYKTILDSFGRMRKNAVINIARGSTSAGLQSFAKHEAEVFYGKNTNEALIFGLFGAAFAGTGVATFVETAFIRRNEMVGKEFKVQPSIFKFNRPITTFYFCREIGFSSAALFSKDLPSPVYYGTMLAAAWLTGACHKLVTIEVTKDLLSLNASVPDYNKGIFQVFRNIAHGNYTYPSLAVPIKNPKNVIQKSVNFLNASCGINMFFWRLTYLTAFSNLYNVGLPYLANRFSLFHSTHEKPAIEEKNLPVNKR